MVSGVRKSSMRRAAAGLARDRLGSSLVEMALVMPTFMMFVLGILKFAQIGYGYNVANYSVQQAARYASLHSGSSLVPATQSSIENMVMPFMGNLGATQSPANCAADNCFAATYSGTNVIGGSVTVAVGLEYCITLPYWKGNGDCIVLISSDTRTIVR